MPVPAYIRDPANGFTAPEQASLDQWYSDFDIDDAFRGVLLPGGEDIQLRALRCLAGLLAQVDPPEQQRFIPLFERAMEVSQHIPVALTALVAFRPADKERYVRLAAAHAPGRLDELVARLDRNVELLRARE